MIHFILAALLVNLPLALSPGPANILCLSIASIKGFKGTLKFIAGLQVLPFFYALIIAFGAGALLTRYHYITDLTKVAGSLYMLYLAVSMLKSQSVISQVKTINNSFTYGVLAQGLNPKNIAIIMTIYSVFSTQAEDYRYGVLLAIIITLCNLLSHLLWSGLAKFIQNSPLTKYQDQFFGALLVVATVLLWI